MTSTDDNQKIGWLLFGSLFVACVMIGLILLILLRFTAPVAPVLECSDELAEQCGPGQDCIDNTCQEAPDRRRACNSGEVCSIDCACGLPRSCVENRCIVPPPATAESVCNDAAQKFIVKLDALYKSCLKEAGGRDPVSCTSDEFAKFTATNEDFGEIITTYGEALLLVFPDSRPFYQAEQRDEWPDKPTLDHYLGYLREREPQFRSASRIIIMGRATKTRDLQTDYSFAKARVMFAQERLTELGDRISTGSITRKLMMFAVGAENKLELDYLMKHETIRVIGWRSNHEEESIGDALATLRAGGQVPRAERNRLEGILNRSVIIVSVPCALPEASP